MNNADKFKKTFGIYATEVWAMPESEFLKWLNAECADAVEVVRCEDCQCYDSKNYYCTYLDNSNGPDGFCNFGEREINDS